MSMKPEKVYKTQVERSFHITATGILCNVLNLKLWWKSVANKTEKNVILILKNTIFATSYDKPGTDQQNLT